VCKSHKKLAKIPSFNIPIEVLYKNATRDITGITSSTPYDHVIFLIANRMDAGPVRMAVIGYIPFYKLKNPKPIPKLLEDEECCAKLVLMWLPILCHSRPDVLRLLEQ
jgi:hypothetical protein